MTSPWPDLYQVQSSHVAMDRDKATPKPYQTNPKQKPAACLVTCSLSWLSPLQSHPQSRRRSRSLLAERCASELFSYPVAVAPRERAVARRMSWFQWQPAMPFARPQTKTGEAPSVQRPLSSIIQHQASEPGFLPHIQQTSSRQTARCQGCLSEPTLAQPPLSFHLSW